MSDEPRAQGAPPNPEANPEANPDALRDASEAVGEAVSDQANEPSPPAAEPASTPAAADAPSPSPAPTASIPAPKLADPRRRRGLDAVAVAAMIAFVLVGGLLVFGFAQALVPAAEAQRGAACRALDPMPKSGPAPELALEDLAGNPVSLADFRGKFVVVNFWATWCQPCAREWPDLDTLAERMSERDDVVILAISVDQDPAEIGPYLERMGLTESQVTIVRATVPDAHTLFGSDKIPDTYFVGRDGELESVFVNIRAWGRAKAVRCVEAAADAAS